MKNIGLAILYTCIISVVSILVIGNILNMIFDYSKSAEISYNLVTHGLSVGIIFTVVICTLIIIDRFK